MGDIKMVRGRVLQPGQNPGQRPSKPVHHIGNHGQAELGETCRIAIGIDDHRCTVRHASRNHMRQQRLATQIEQVLVATAHAARLAPGQKKIERHDLPHFSAPRHDPGQTHDARAAAMGCRRHPHPTCHRQTQCVARHSAR